MVKVRPDFYDDFRCIASDCRHSCCIGWEIDIDAATAGKYRNFKGTFGDELRRNISFSDEPHFILTDDERCPFLQPDGLCRLILAQGEDSLCDICREHPRFYNTFPGREECGLGLCCEEAVRLFLSVPHPLELIGEGSGGDDDRLLSLRQQLFSVLHRQDISLVERMEICSEVMGCRLLPFDLNYWRDVFLSLERLDEAWTEHLNAVSEAVEPSGMEFERLTEYLLYRHFASSADEDEAALMLQLVFLSVRLISSCGGELADTIRLFSSEIEYSDENIEILLDRIDEMADLLYK